VVIPEHYEAVFARKPRARVMAYRDWLVRLPPPTADYVSQLCRKRYGEMETQILALYQLAHQAGEVAFGTAVTLAHQQQTFGAEYVQTLLTQQSVTRPQAEGDLLTNLPAALALPQPAVERALAHYEQYVVNHPYASGGEP
jgi:hypothetical protein